MTEPPDLIPFTCSPVLLLGGDGSAFSTLAQWDAEDPTPHDCAVMVQTGPPIITRVDLVGVPDDLRAYSHARRAMRVAFPPGAWFTIAALSSIFGVTEHHIRVILNTHKEDFGPPVYRELRRWKGRRYRMIRILSEPDYNHLRTLFPVIVGYTPKKKKK